MKFKIVESLYGLKDWIESEEMCYMALNGGFEFEIKNKLAFQLQQKYNKNNSVFFVKEAKIGKSSNTSKIVDIISIAPNEQLKETDFFYIDGENIKNKVDSSIELGHNYLSQPTNFMMDKTKEDVAKCFEAGIRNNLFTIQIATDITRIDNTARLFFKASYLNGVKSHIKNRNSEKCLSAIRNYYQSLDNQFSELSFKNNWNNFEVTIYFFILSHVNKK